MFQKFAPLGLGQANFDLAQKPIVIAYQPLNGLAYEGPAVASLLRGDLVEPSLQFRRKLYFTVSVYDRVCHRQ